MLPFLQKSFFSSFVTAAERKAAASVAEVRSSVEQQVLSDLADHPTVAYIKRIEDERTYYKEQLHEEVTATHCNTHCNKHCNAHCNT